MTILGDLLAEMQRVQLFNLPKCAMLRYAWLRLRQGTLMRSAAAQWVWHTAGGIGFDRSSTKGRSGPQSALRKRVKYHE